MQSILHLLVLHHPQSISNALSVPSHFTTAKTERGREDVDNSHNEWRGRMGGGREGMEGKKGERRSGNGGEKKKGEREVK